MLLSHRYNFLFVHIAKTGGTSVRAALQRKIWADPYRIPLFICSKLSKMAHHRLGCKFPRHAKAIAAQEMLPLEFYNQLFKFAFVRNPWDLQVSSFHHIKRERPHLLQGHDQFGDFLRYKFDPERPYQYHLDTSIELQSDYVIDLHGKLIIDYMGHYESLQEDFDHICEKVGLTAEKLPHKRKATDRGEYRKYYTDTTVELVAQHFAADIKMFNYKFE